MNKKMIPTGMMVILSFAVAVPMGIGFLVRQRHEAYAYNNQHNAQSDLTFPGSNAGDEPATSLTSHDKGHCYQYIQDHPGLAIDKKTVLERY